MVRAGGERRGRGGDALLVAGDGAGGADAGGDDELAARLGEGAQAGGFVGRGDDAVGAGREGAAGALDDDVAERAFADEGGVEVGAVERGEDGDGEERVGASPRPATAALTTCGSPWTVRKSGATEATMPRVAAVTVAPISKSFMSRKTRLPLALRSRARSSPPEARRPRPIL